MKEPLLRVQDLHTVFSTESGPVYAVNGVSFDLQDGEILGIVGESGSGKSVTAYAVMQILAPNARITQGSILYRREDVTRWNEAKLRRFRGGVCSIVFQDPMTSLNPVFTIGNQLAEAITLHTDKRGRQVTQRAEELLTMVGINDPKRRLAQYPFELSGGMRQRVMIAMALACEPEILIADEPTTALDVTVQAQILELIQNLQREMGMAVILVTHDLGVVAGMCDNVMVMYGGRVCERGTVEDVFYHPQHQYTKGLLRSVPRPGGEKERLQAIPGSPVHWHRPPQGCPFCSRCDKTMEICLTKMPRERTMGPTHTAACWESVRQQWGEEGSADGETAVGGA